jgi:hypothetical protein
VVGEPGAKAGGTCLSKLLRLAHLVKLEAIGSNSQYFFRVFISLNQEIFHP